MNFMNTNTMYDKSDLGTAKDNMNSPIHNWYRFTQGFHINSLTTSLIIHPMKLERFMSHLPDVEQHWLQPKNERLNLLETKVSN